MQVIQAEIGKERYQIDHFPEMEREELVQFYLRKGFRREAAERIADFLMGNKDVVLQEDANERTQGLPGGVSVTREAGGS